MKLPLRRFRRLRTTAALRDLLRETQVNRSDLVWPIFVSEKVTQRQEVPSMPGVFQWSVAAAAREAAAAWKEGVRAVLLFGIPAEKDEAASQAYDAEGIVQRAIRAIRLTAPEMIVITDVCLCEFMAHGHCGVADFSEDEVRVDNDATLPLLVATALSHAEAGAHIVAPSDMMDGRVAAIREALDANGYHETGILSYAAKFASAFYGPFRDAAESAPMRGDRRSYQMDSGNALEALREVALDVEEGADLVMVKPGLAYLDLLWRVKERFGLPTVSYHVSGEYAMLKAAAANGWIDERAALLETLTAFKRAGADLIITYSARDAAAWLDS